MNVVAFNGSARRDGNTAVMIRQVFEELEKAGIATEMVQLAGSPIRGCSACYQCFAKKDKRCSMENDRVNSYIEKMADADGIILASPTYFADVSSEMKALIERAGFVARANDNLFRRKAGAGIVSVRRGGSIHAFDTLNHFFLITEMIVVGSDYWNTGFGGREKDAVEKDKEGMVTMKTLGRNMAWLLERLRG